MKAKRIIWGAALLILCGALVFFNLPEDAPGKYESDAPVGSAAGEQAPDFTLTLMDGQPFTLSAHRGQAVVINLWATWCTPCVNELPHFDALQRQHPGDVAVLAIHSDLITDDVAGYLSAFDYGIEFAVDEGGAVIASLGGSTMLPQTIVLNRRGEIIYNQVGSVTLEALEELTQRALDD